MDKYLNTGGPTCGTSTDQQEPQLCRFSPLWMKLPLHYKVLGVDGNSQVLWIDDKCS